LKWKNLFLVCFWLGMKLFGKENGYKWWNIKAVKWSIFMQWKKWTDCFILIHYLFFFFFFEVKVFLLLCDVIFIMSHMLMWNRVSICVNDLDWMRKCMKFLRESFDSHLFIISWRHLMNSCLIHKFWEMLYTLEW
jgi:hypothetical protein